MIIVIKKLKKEAIVPEYQTEGAACFDLHACTNDPIVIWPGDFAAIPTGLAFEVPDGFELQIRARSGLAAKYGIGIVNGIGTIDSDYRGEIFAILINWGKEPFVVEKDMRIAQGTVKKFEKVEFIKEVLKLVQ